MTYQTKNLLRILLLLLFLIGVFGWLLYGNRGYVVINNLKSPYTLVVPEYRQFVCYDDKCRFALPFGERQVCIQKEGFFEDCARLTIPWRKQLEYAPQLQRIPSLSQDKAPISIEPDAEAIDADPLRTVTADGKEYFFQADTGQLRRGSPQDVPSSKLIATFFQLSGVALTALENDIIVATQSEIFLVDTDRFSRQRIYAGTDISFAPLSAEYLAIAEADRLFLYRRSDEVITRLPFFTKPTWLALCDANSLIVSRMTEKNTETGFYRYDFVTGNETPITSATLHAADFSMECADEPEAVRLVFENEQRFLLRF